jgi:cytochrome c peroxidase
MVRENASRKWYGLTAGAVAGILLLAGLKSFLVADETRQVPAITAEMVDSMKVLPGGLGALDAVPSPADNPQTEAKVELGRRLFFDPRLSLDRSTSCASCHSPEKAFTDGLARSKGFQGVSLPRNSPTVLNAAYNSAQFWDGRAATLDEQCKGPLMSAAEMSMIDEQHLVQRLNHIPAYAQDFKTVFNAGPSLDRVAKAIAAFERTLVTPDSRFDRYAHGDKSALNATEKRGLALFFSKAACSECHKGPNFTDNQYHDLGIAGGDAGRYYVTRKEEDRNAFKTPTLRNVELTAPYMHDGTTATLQEVIDLYDRGGGERTHKSKLLYPLNLTVQEKADLLAFLKTLTGTIPRVDVPEMYPEIVTAGGQGR